MKIANKITISFLVASLALIAVVAPIFYIIELRSSFFLFLLFIPMLAWMVASYVSRIISKPILRLYKDVEIIGKGDLYHRAGRSSNDEIGELSRAFDRMTEDLRQTTTFVDELNREKEEHEKTERDLREREEHYRRLFEQSNDAVFLYDTEGRIFDVNSKACDMLGYGKEELLKISFMDLHAEDELIRSKEAIKTGKETCSVRFESMFRKADGKAVDVEISSSVVDMKEGIMQGIVRDIAESKKLERDLMISEEKFRTFMETASDMMYITDKNCNFTYVNGAMARTLGYSKEDMCRMGIFDVSNKKTREKFGKMLEGLIEKGEVFYEPVWMTKDGKEVFGEMRVVGIYHGNSVFSGSRGVFRDITERKKIEESQRLAQLGKLISDMAHEVNNPLQVISGRAEFSLMTEKNDKKTKEALEVIVDQCDWAKNIIQRLLMFSKPSKGKVEDVDINESIDFVIGLVEYQFSLGNVKIIKDFSGSLPVVKADKKQMQEVFMNLLRNAAEAMPEGGTVTVTTKKDADELRVEFKDTGTGIYEKDIDKIFDPFFTTREKGTGLGLSVCYGIIKSHGGDLTYFSEPGEGTTATMILPIR
ncbi:MAG: PAS domain S-box protein [Candidatus Omnitrophota bacterium]|nr:PAS domain S-box protein [Candidatus Omnitrophota bacterium]